MGSSNVTLQLALGIEAEDLFAGFRPMIAEQAVHEAAHRCALVIELVRDAGLGDDLGLTLEIGRRAADDDAAMRRDIVQEGVEDVTAHGIYRDIQLVGIFGGEHALRLTSVR